MELVHLSVTGQTRHFIRKLDLPTYGLELASLFFEVNESFILVIPTHDIEITEIVNDFFDHKNNQELLAGVASGGDRDSAELFVYAARDIARDYHVPLLYSSEFSGTDEDTETFKRVVEEIGSKRN